MSEDNIFQLVTNKKDEEKPGYIKVTYASGEIEMIQADSFGVTQEMPEYITLFSDNPDKLVGFVNNRYIKKLEIIEDYDNSESN
jgi:hypothetical protein